MDITPKLQIKNRDRGEDAEALAFRVTVLLTVLLPTLGLGAAIYTLWGRWVTATDLGIALLLYAATAVSVSVGFHRLFTHRSFECNAGVKLALGITGSMATQGPLFYWVATHRLHHQASDRPGDPHSPHEFGRGFRTLLRGWAHAHFGWLFAVPGKRYFRVVADLARDPVAAFINRHYLLWIALGLLAPAVVSGWVSGSWRGVLTGFIWGGLARTFLVHHVTWSINSICHLFGTQSFETGDESRNNPLCALVSFGEGWHNNHHGFPTSARLGLRWWEVDFGYWLIAALRACGLAADVCEPSAIQQQAKSRQVSGRPGSPS